MASSARFKRRVAYVGYQSAPHVAHNDQELLCVQIFSKVSRAQLVWGSRAGVGTKADIHSAIDLTYLRNREIMRGIGGFLIPCRWQLERDARGERGGVTDVNKT